MRLRTQHLVLICCFLIVSCHRTPRRIILVEVERAEGIHMGTEMRYCGMLIGHVESVTLAAPHKFPVAKVVLARDSPPFTSTDEFHVGVSGLLGDRFIEATPGASPGVPLANAATVRAETPGLLHFDNMNQVADMLGSLNLITDLVGLPKPKRTEVLNKIQKLLDDAKKESTNK